MKRKALVINDEEDDFRRGYNAKKSDAKNAGFWDSTVDDGPVVVEDVIPVTRIAKGSWDEITVEDSSISKVTIHSRINDDSPPRRPTTNSIKRDDDSPPRRPTTNSIKRDDESPPRRPTANTNSVKRDDDSPPRRPTTNSVKRDDDSPPRRPTANTNIIKRDDESPPRRPTTNTNDSTTKHDEEMNKPIKNETIPQLEENAVYNLPRPKVQQPTAAAHVAGLQSSSDFAKREKELQEIKKNELKAIDPSLSGQFADTVYRDKRGRKLDMLNEFMRQEAIREGKEVKLKEATLEWGKATVQKQEQIEKIKEYEEVINETFARSVDNPRLEKMRKETLREGDPMAAYLNSSNSIEEPVEEVQVRRSSGKPAYKGPTPRPNRFGIAPGYRWDGIERGINYEAKILKKFNDNTANKEREYLHSVSDL
jgi:pre-mRNA-splicing factor CWC26